MKEILIGIASGMVAALGMGGGTILILLLGIFTRNNSACNTRNKFNCIYSNFNCCNFYECKKQNYRL